ncbi:MAG TPA: amidohydrolase family protein [bacterium]|nr:amidohydrolase family protein [bacterium]
MITLHCARWVLPIDRPAIPHGAVAIDGRMIAWVGSFAKRPRAYRALPVEQVIDHGHAALMPGFVNAHSHVLLHEARGLMDGVGFWEWLGGAIVTLDLKDPSANREACLAGFREGLAAGITCWGDNHFRLEPFQAAMELGIKATCFLEIFGIRGDVDRQRDELLAKLAQARAESNGDVVAGISPHAPYTVPPPLLELAGRLSRDEGYLLSTHLAETKEEVEFLRSPRGPVRKLMGRHSRTLIPPTDLPGTRYLKRHGCLTDRTLVVHGVHLTPPELRDLARSGATLVHCPVSNSRLRCGIAPIEEAAATGVRLALGTDSAASGERHDPFLAMGLALHLQQSLHPSGVLDAVRLLQAATLDGARALHRDRELGSLTAGKRADLVALALLEPRRLSRRTVEEEIVYGAERSWVRGVWVDGVRRV